MKKIPILLIILLGISMVPWGLASDAVATLQIVAGEPWIKEIPGAIVNWTGKFYYTNGEWEAEFKVYFTETGNPHSVLATETGIVDADGKYIWILKNVQTQDNPESKELGLFESWYSLTVELIDPISGKVVVSDSRDGRSYTLYIGDKVEIGQFEGNEKTVLELKDIKTTLLGAKAKLVLHHIIAVSGTVEAYPNPGYPLGTELTEGTAINNKTIEEPKVPPLNLTTPTAVIIVGENAAGADVAAGAKVAIAVQKWIDIVKEKGGEIAVPELGKLSGAIAKTVTTPIQNLNADAMLDTEVKDPDMVAPIVYTVGGPVANEYTAQILASREDLPVKFVKENGKWYLVSKYGDKWEGSYGVIMTVPAAKDVFELQQRLLEGKIKVADVIVAGLDRWGTYGACELLQGEFLNPILGKEPKKELMPFLELQTRMLFLFSQNPLDAFMFSIDPSSPFKLQPIAIVVDKDGKIVKVIGG
ncbi:hypothetical protein [Pyrococcus kukulkanii]|uniref:hypothetical protein n=1 Tax=Pyrococcus kukulkanii TaxID=1609559 RepID=UPI0035626193